MNFFNFDIKKIVTYLLLISLPLISINMQQSTLREGWFNQPFSFLSGLLQNGLFVFTDGVRSTTLQYLDLMNIKGENRSLHEENRQLRAQLQVMSELEIENQRLVSLLDFKQKSKMELVAARLISKDLLTDHRTLQINKGTHHGLVQGQAVITTGGVVGYVFRPQLLTSHVLLINDRFSVVDGINSRSRARGIVEGKGTDKCALKYVEKSEDIKVGDLIVTSGLDNIFPKGFPIAVVDNIEDKKFMVSLKVDLKPVVDPNKIEEVFVILNAAGEESQLTMVQ